MTLFGNTSGGIGITCERCGRRASAPLVAAAPLLTDTGGWTVSRCPACAAAPPGPSAGPAPVPYVAPPPPPGP
jgi:hypothetical protein